MSLPPMTFPILVMALAALLTVTYMRTAFRQVMRARAERDAPEDPARRDKRLITEAATVLDASIDPATGKCSPAAIQRATEILRTHTLPKHAVNALVRERDRERIERSAQAALEQAAEDAEMDRWKAANQAKGKKPYTAPAMATLDPSDPKAITLTRPIQIYEATEPMGSEIPYTDPRLDPAGQVVK